VRRERKEEGERGGGREGIGKEREGRPQVVAPVCSDKSYSLIAMASQTKPPKKTAGKWQKCNLVSGMASVASNMGWL